MHIQKIHNSNCPKPNQNTSFGRISKAAKETCLKYLSLHPEKNGKEILQQMTNMNNAKIYLDKFMKGEVEFLQVRKNPYDGQKLLVSMRPLSEIKKSIERFIQ